MRNDIDSGSIPNTGGDMNWILGFSHCPLYSNTESYLGIALTNPVVCRWWSIDERTF